MLIFLQGEALEWGEGKVWFITYSWIPSQIHSHKNKNTVNEYHQSQHPK